MTLFKDINQLAEDVETAAAAYDEAQKQASYARMRETEALNRLNKAQAAFDNAVAEAQFEEAAMWAVKALTKPARPGSGGA